MKATVCALHKSGSMFLYKFFKVVARMTKTPYVSINNPTYQRNLLNGNHYIHCPLRYFPNSVDPNQIYIFQIRDPRDCLVSEYFSFGYTHHIGQHWSKEQQEIVRSYDINEYARKRMTEKITITIPYPDKIKNVIEFSKLDNVIVVKYEEMVTDFPNWVRKVTKPFNLHENRIKQLITKFGPEFQNIKELTPDQIKRGAKRHTRKMYPGDYLDKLDPETIEYVNQMMADYLTHFGYLS